MVKLKQIGKISHYYDKIRVAVVDLTSALEIGDKIKISGHDQEYIQQINSMQMEYKQIDKAKKGDSVGILVDKKVKEGDSVFLESAK